MSIAVLVVAAGRGARFAAGTSEDDATPKQYQMIGTQSIIARTLATFTDHQTIDLVVPIIHEDDDDLYASAVPNAGEYAAPIHGGITRQASVYAGLAYLSTLPTAPDKVLIHDAVRPFVTHTDISRVLTALEHHEGAIPATSVTDTIKVSARGATIDATADRNKLFAAQTPQGFDFAKILKAHESARAMPEYFTDDASIAEAAGISVALVTGNPANVKITYAQDLKDTSQMFETRTGLGYDIHAFEDGDHVTLGGIDIPHTAKLKGHSDADMALHALTDALFGALAEGDIGQHFPPSDPQWRGASSQIFIEKAVSRVKARGGRITHMDVTLVCEAPKIGPHTQAMRENIAKICDIEISRISVKATTSEKMGFIGKGEGMAAHAVATIMLPFEDNKND